MCYPLGTYAHAFAYVFGGCLVTSVCNTYACGYVVVKNRLHCTTLVPLRKILQRIHVY